MTGHLHMAMTPKNFSGNFHGLNSGGHNNAISLRKHKPGFRHLDFRREFLKEAHKVLNIGT